MANERARFASSLALSLSNRSHLLVLSSSSCFAFLLRLAPSPSLFTQAKAALVYKTLLSQGKAIAKVTVGAVKDSICPAPLSSFELSLFSSAAFARAAAAAGWRALNQSTFLSVDPLLPSDSSSSAPSPSFSGDCVVARVLDDGATAAAPDALLVRCRVSTSRLRRPSFLEGGDDGGGGGGGIGEGEIDLFKVSASVRGKVACVLPTLEEVLLVDAVPRVEGDDVLVSAWEEAVGAGGNGESSSCSSSFSSSPFWLRAIPRIEVEDDCGDGEELSFATSEKGKREGKLVPPAALLAAPARSSLPLAGASRAGGGGNGGVGVGGSNYLIGAFLSALASPAFSDLWGGQPLAFEGTARLIPRPPAPLFGRPSFGAGAAKGAAAARSSFATSFSWVSSSSRAQLLLQLLPLLLLLLLLHLWYFPWTSMTTRSPHFPSTSPRRRPTLRRSSPPPPPPTTTTTATTQGGPPPRWGPG